MASVDASLPRRGRWLEFSLVSSAFSGVPALVASAIFGMSLQKPLVDRIAPELAHLHQSLGSRLELTAPLTMGVALVALMWLKRMPDITGLRILLSSAALFVSTWLGKTFAFGMTASARAADGRFVVHGNHLVWETDPTAALTNALAESYWTHGLALLVNYYRLYGPVQFGLSVACGVVLGGYWAYRLRDV